MAYFEYEKKRVFYESFGKGEESILIIHGNSVSGKMHQNFAKKLGKHMCVYTLDLPGHGRSERYQDWPVDFWFEHTHCVAELITHLDIAPCYIIGYSGGALIALNLALEYPNLLKKIIADSFEGEHSEAAFAESIYEDRSRDKKKWLAKLFWWNMHGWDWAKVVDQDSKVVFEHHRTVKNFFHKKLEELSSSILLTGGLEDEYISNIDNIFSRLAIKIPNSKTIIYEKGKHPACLTVGNKYIEDIVEFLFDNK